MSSHGVVEMIAVHMNNCSRSFTLLVSSCVNYVLVETALAAVSVHQHCGPLINTFLHGRRYLIFNWVEGSGLFGGYDSLSLSLFILMAIFQVNLG